MKNTGTPFRVNQGRPLRSLLVGFIVFGLTLLLYVALRSENYIGDGVQFALAIDSGDWRQLLRPNHMLYPLVAWRFAGVWNQLAGKPDTLRALQILSADFGAFAISLAGSAMGGFF